MLDRVLKKVRLQPGSGSGQFRRSQNQDANHGYFGAKLAPLIQNSRQAQRSPGPPGPLREN